MDLTMPGMDEARALASMRELCPDVRVVLMSGHSEQELSQRFAKLSLDGLLQKPFRPADLLDRVRQAIAPSMGYS
jgi:DNA-binding NarL/FixJ family response regulator